MGKVKHRLGGTGIEIKRDPDFGILVEWPDESRSWEDPRDIISTIGGAHGHPDARRRHAHA